MMKAFVKSSHSLTHTHSHFRLLPCQGPEAVEVGCEEGVGADLAKAHGHKPKGGDSKTCPSNTGVCVRERA